jgi:hypothetical protein
MRNETSLVKRPGHARSKSPGDYRALKAAESSNL